MVSSYLRFMTDFQIEGSVEEDSTKSDDEFDDLAMRDGLDNYYWSDDDESTNLKKIADSKMATDGDGVMANKYQHNLELFFKMSELFVGPPYSDTLLPQRNSSTSDIRVRRRSLSDSMCFESAMQSIPAVGHQRAL